MPEYRELRKKHSMLELCKTPELAVQVTLQPLRRFPDLDAAILFSDILLMLDPMGVRVDFVKGEGPSIDPPVRTESDVTALKPLEPERDLASVLQAIAILRKELEGKTPLIGFCGAPFTIASYLIEGGPSKDYARTKAMMQTSPAVWNRLMEKLSDAIIHYLRAQIRAGVQAVQVFDSWIGALTPADYRLHVLPHCRKIFDGVKGAVPMIHFGTQTADLLTSMKEAGGDVIGVDWRIPLDEAWKRLGPDVAVQGNLDPAAMLLPEAELIEKVDEVLDRAAGRPGHIFNLGHGLVPETPMENVAAVIEHVHRRTRR